jgi:single-stranded-DNA-specific exonuclease
MVLNPRWIVSAAQPMLAAVVMRQLGVSQLLARCLVNRGMGAVEAASAFLAPRLRALEDPALLPDMGRAVQRLLEARAQREPVVLFGDYDVDGVTAATLLSEVLGALGWGVSVYLPNRFDEGYGLTPDAVDNCLARHPARLLLAVDCGSTAAGVIDGLRQRGVDVIVLDHHQVCNPPPRACALVNPQLLPAEARSARDLCSVGLAFKLGHAVVKRLREAGDPAALELDLRGWLDLVALGTIADLVPLRGENRALVASGLERLTTTQRPGLRALRGVAGASGKVGVYEVGFQLAPRLNAAGRLEDAQEAFELLACADAAAAARLAESLNARNRERQTIERGIADQAIAALRARFDPGRDLVIVEGQMDWHVGVVGIVASRVAREFYRPTIILGGEGTAWRGSGRSIDGFDLAAALRECGDLLERHGGHAMAAGLSLQMERVDALRERLNAIARRTLAGDQLRPKLELDADVALSDLSLERMLELGRLEPFGVSNPPVRLLARGLRMTRPPQRIGREQQHLRLWVGDGTCALEGVWWGAGGRTLPGEPFDLAFQPEINDYNGRTSVRLKVLDLRRADAAPQDRPV